MRRKNILKMDLDCCTSAIHYNDWEFAFLNFMNYINIIYSYYLHFLCMEVFLGLIVLQFQNNWFRTDTVL